MESHDWIPVRLGSFVVMMSLAAAGGNVEAREKPRAEPVEAKSGLAVPPETTPVMAPPPPAPRVAQPAIIIEERSARSQNPPPARFDVVIAAKRQTLWQGTLRMAGRGGSVSYNMSKSEQLDDCGGDSVQERRDITARENLQFSINRYGWQNDPGRFTASLSYAYPTGQCETLGSSTVGISRQFDIEAGESIVLEGEGGLTVRISRKL